MRALAALLLALCAGLPALARDTLTIGITQFPGTLNPVIESMAAKSYILAFARRPFTTFDKDWKLVCLLCVELPTFENGAAETFDLPDGRKGVRLTYRIQPAATWGDGRPVTAEDVKFSWEVGRTPQSGVTNLELYRRITEVEVIDAKTFRLTVDKLSFTYNAINDLQVLPAHLERAAFADPAQYRVRTRYDTDPANPGLWFGPYRVTQVMAGSHVVLERNPSWWGPPPAFRRIVVRAIENTAALEANLLSGEIDMIAGELGLSLDQALAFEKRHGRRFQVIYKPGLVYEHMDVMLDNPILADIRVRRALLHGLDREAINRRLFEGRQPVAATSVQPLDWVHTDRVATYPFDPARAAALLDQAGWRPGPGGVRVNAAGERLALELMTTAGNRTRELIQQVIQSQWRQIGVELRLRNEPPRVFFGETVSRRRFTGLALFAWISSPENVPRTTLHSQMIPTEANGWGGQNYTGFRNPEMDALIEAIDIELDREKRRALWHRLQEIYAEELPALPLFFRADAFILPAWLHGLEPTGHQYASALWAENWRAAPAAR
ncbi:MAG: peptide ABC transporter substrate-binding protein [Thalassobaculales bacterium]